MSDVLFNRVRELETMLRRERKRTEVARRERDKWKARAKALEPDAMAQRRWAAHLSRILPSRPEASLSRLVAAHNASGRTTDSIQSVSATNRQSKGES